MRVGLAGLGYWGRNLLRNASELENLDVLAVCDLDQRALDRHGRRYPHLAQTRDFAAALPHRPRQSRSCAWSRRPRSR